MTFNFTAKKDLDLAAWAKMPIPILSSRKANEAVHHVLSKQEPWQELGATCLDERNKGRLVNRVTQRIKPLGYWVTLEPTAVDTA